MRVVGLLFLAAIALGALKSFGEPEYLTYKEFLSEVRAGKIVRVNLDHLSRIEGIRRVDGKEQEFETYGDTGSANDPLLTDLLRQSSVPMSIAPERERGIFDWEMLGSVVFLLGVPVATLVMVAQIRAKMGRLEREQQDIAETARASSQSNTEGM